MNRLTVEQIVEAYFMQRDGKTSHEIGEALNVNSGSIAWCLNHLKKNWSPTHNRLRASTYKAAINMIRVRLMQDAKLRNGHAKKSNGHTVLVTQPKESRELLEQRVEQKGKQLVTETEQLINAFADFQGAVMRFIDRATEEPQKEVKRLTEALRIEREKMETLVEGIDEAKNSNLVGFLSNKFQQK